MNYPEFYYGLNTYQSCIILLNKLLDGGERIDNINGYPSSVNYTGNNNVQEYSNSGFNFIPCKNQSIIGINNYKSLINSFNFKNALNKKDNEILLYHACNWSRLESILGWIDPTASRQEPTDFGKNNFYTTDSFKAAFIWSSRQTQSAIIVFKIPNNLIDQFVDEDKKLLFNHLNNLIYWKELVFKCRKTLSFGTDIRSKTLHRKYIEDVDKHEFISGPILKNRNISSSIEADYIRYNNGEIPYQLSFKNQRICDILHSFISLLLVFEES